MVNINIYNVREYKHIDHFTNNDIEPSPSITGEQNENNIIATFKNGLSKQNWVGLYSINDIPDIDKPIIWAYLNGKKNIPNILINNGKLSLDITNISDGNYYLYLFKNRDDLEIYDSYLISISKKYLKANYHIKKLENDKDNWWFKFKIIN